MVKARSSGVAFSLDTTAPDKNTMVIVGGWGLGDYIVEGNSPTDTFILSKGKEPEIVERSVTVKPLGRYQADTGGLETRKIEPSRRNHPCLSDPEIIELGKTVKQLELFFKKPQDVEWSVDECGTLHILQARPLAVAKEALLTRTEVLMETLSGYEQICNLQGRVAQQGIASGPVFIVNGPADLVDFPDGAILVSRLDSSHYVKVMKRAAAIVTEIGTPVSHMATLCREMHVPCLVNVGSILNRVTNGEQITVDAEDRVVYRGRVHELLAYSSTSTMQVSYTY
jgi:pyruvate,water dikinase